MTIMGTSLAEEINIDYERACCIAETFWATSGPGWACSTYTLKDYLTASFIVAGWDDKKKGQASHATARLTL